MSAEVRAARNVVWAADQLAAQACAFATDSSALARSAAPSIALAVASAPPKSCTSACALAMYRSAVERARASTMAVAVASALSKIDFGEVGSSAAVQEDRPSRSTVASNILVMVHPPR